MDTIEALRKQHTDLMYEATRIEGLLDERKLAEDARAARSALAMLSGKLKVHTVMEDMVIYPSLIAHRENSVSALARLFNAEMGSLSRDFQGYLMHWPSHAAIANNPALFIRETRNVLAALERRIKREDNELYPLVDGDM